MQEQVQEQVQVQVQAETEAEVTPRTEAPSPPAPGQLRSTLHIRPSRRRTRIQRPGAVLYGPGAVAAMASCDPRSSLGRAFVESCYRTLRVHRWRKGCLPTESAHDASMRPFNPPSTRPTIVVSPFRLNEVTTRAKTQRIAIPQTGALTWIIWTGSLDFAAQISTLPRASQ